MTTETNLGSLGCDFRHAKIIGMTWVPYDGGRKKCCDKYRYGAQFSYDMCMAICTLCCKKLIIDFACEDVDPREGDRVKNADDPREFPTTTVTDSGVSFTSSSYGVPLPIVYGSDKLNGNVFWASPIKRNLLASGTEYYNTMDFALGLCEGEIDGVVRMWLGDKLVLDNSVTTDVNDVAQPNVDGFVAGATIDLTDPDSPLRNLPSTVRQTEISIFSGSETQLPEGIIVTREGYENTPAYRGVAYILFKNFIIGGNSIPNLFVEVTSNTEATYPRVYGNPISPEEKFDSMGGEFLIVDPGFSFVYTDAEDGNGTATPPNGSGILRLEYNTLGTATETEIVVTEGYTPNYPLTRLLPITGFLMLCQTVTNSGTLRTWNPFTQTVMDSFGPGGGVSDHSLSTGFSALGKGSIAFSTIGSETDVQTDVFMAIGVVNTAIGFAEIMETGEIIPVSNLGAVMPKDDARSAFLTLSGTFAKDTPTFMDGVTSTLGHHALVFSYDTDERTVFNVGIITVYDGQTSLLAAPSWVEIGTIDCDDLFGRGIAHNISTILIDPSDKMPVVFFRSGSRTPIAVKYNIYTGAVVWSSPAYEYPDMQGGDVAYCPASRYAWVGSTSGIYTINMQTGEVVQEEAIISNVNLPVLAGGDQFYNGAEDSITYTSTTTGKLVTKFFLTRVSQTTVDLADIVEDLLSRVGLLSTDMDISDLNSLTLNGYTVSQKKTLRAIFSELGQVFKFDVIESNGRIKYKTRGDAAGITINHKHLADVNEAGWLNTIDENDISRIRKINLKYRDFTREYRDNIQSVLLPRYGNQNFDNDAAISVDVPVVLTSDAAKSLAEILLYSKLVSDTTYEALLPPRYMYLDPADVIKIQRDTNTANDVTMRIRRAVAGGDKSVRIEASQEDPDIYTQIVNLFAADGRYDASVFDAVPPRIEPFPFLIPFRSFEEADDVSDKYVLYTTFLNHKSSAVLENDITLSVDGTETYTIKRPTAFPTWGYVLNPPDFKTSRYATDDTSQLRVKIMHSGFGVPASSTLAGLIASNSCNLAYCGGELLQFTTVVDEGDSVYLLTGLHRAKMGTDPFAGVQVTGDKFILLGNASAVLDDASVRSIKLPVASPKFALQYQMKTGNPFQPALVKLWTAINLRSFTVADLHSAWSTDDAVFTWTRRTRYGDEFLDDGAENVPLNEIDESYVVFVHVDEDVFDASNPDTYLRKETVTSPTYTYTLAKQTEDGYDNLTTDLFAVMYQEGSALNFRVGAARQILLEHK